MYSTMISLPLTKLRAFAAVFETGGVRPAARKLSVSHSVVSRQIAELQSWIGTSLLKENRGNQPVEFTSSGRMLGEATLSGLGIIENAVRQIQERHSGNAVILETTSSIATRWIFPRLQSFEKHCPGIELSVTVDQRLNTSHKSDCDIMVRMGQGPWDGFDCTPIMDDWLLPMMSEKYWLNQNRPSVPRDITSLSLLHDRDPATSWARWFDRYALQDVQSNKGARYTSSDLLLRAAEQNLGVALGRYQMAREDLNRRLLYAPLGRQRNIHVKDAYWILLPPGQTRQAVLRVRDWILSEVDNCNFDLVEF